MYNRRKKFRSTSRKPHGKKRRSGKRIKKYGVSRGGIRL